MEMEESIQAHKDQLRERRRQQYRQSSAAVLARRRARWQALTPEEQEAKKAVQKTRTQQWRLNNRGYHREYLKTYRSTPEGREVFRRASKNAKLKRLNFVQSLKAASCKDCKGAFPPECMEFDHRDPADKLFTISTFGRRVGQATLEEEIAKCDVVCANCHRIRTAARRKKVDIAPEVSTLPS